ncbi:hypothetical protein NCS56_01405000 [Fusarium sp. Ph1]|nr:hypothetical protein NCS56_01405000 [Fusarium sp. Ph1]
MKLQLTQVLALASCGLAQVESSPPSGEHYSSIPLNTLSKNSTSVNAVPYQSNASLYYLGYEGDDWSRPFSKYWNPVMKRISDEVQKGITESPYASELAYTPQEAADYLTRPGYLQLENGWAVGDDGTVMLAIRTDMHDERYIGSYSFIDEFIGNFAVKLTVNFVDPESVGFNTSAFASQGIETIVVGRITNEHVTNVTGNSYLMHQIRRKEDGRRELRSRFFLEHFTEDQAHQLGVHCAVEMSHLATFLPQLYAEFKDTL